MKMTLTKHIDVSRKAIEKKEKRNAILNVNLVMIASASIYL
jgi:DNA-binding XRE family transcriptional regulator